jgi:hypothetical protein
MSTYTAEGMSIAFMMLPSIGPRGVPPELKTLMAYVAAHLRPADRVEAHLSHEFDAIRAVTSSMSLTREFAVIFDPGLAECEGQNPMELPLAIGGVCPVETERENVGVIWMLGTDLLDREMRYPMQRRLFARATQMVVQEFSKNWPVLTNMTYAENTKSLRWLKWLGFELGREHQLGETRARFVEFRKEA